MLIVHFVFLGKNRQRLALCAIVYSRNRAGTDPVIGGEAAFNGGREETELVTLHTELPGGSQEGYLCFMRTAKLVNK